MTDLVCGNLCVNVGGPIADEELRLGNAKLPAVAWRVL
jgi:hypothetical protein